MSNNADEVKAIGPKLLGLLYILRQKAATWRAFQVISGYRSPRTNAPRNHIALPGCRLERLRQLVLSLRGDGVGYYPGPGFIDLDTGPVRQWS